MRPIAVLFAVAVATAAAAPTYWWLRAPAPEAPSPASAKADAAPALPSGWIDAPVDEAIFGNTLSVDGWAVAPSSIRSVDVRIAGQSYAAQYGLARPDVAAQLPKDAHAGVSGFRYSRTFDDLALLRYPFSVVAVDALGQEKLLGRRSLIPAGAMALWETASSGHAPGAPFYFLMATSGVGKGGADEVPRAYAGYASITQRIGIAVPVLYMRTTKGKDADWVFDPSFDVSRKCGERFLAEDSLDSIFSFAIKSATPVQFILNGGIWADASCDVPEWDVNDALEADAQNCQWTQDDRVYPDDYLKNLSGSTASPELARSLTLNVYAREVRHYKKRNLQAAAARIADFARRHPDLFVGINLDSDTYVNPFFEQREWFDYNPRTLRQFREWLQGIGPYAAKPHGDVPDLSRHRRKAPMTLADVNRMAGATWKRWADVQPPRRFPGSLHSPQKPGEALVWDDPWYQTWDMFRKQLVANHYDDLARWTHEAGIPKSRIFTAQGFAGPEGPARPFAISLESVGQNYDSGGVSVEGSIPRDGHLGAILYGPAAENRVRMENRYGLFATFARMDPGWAVVETNLADLRRPQTYPTYAQSYRAFRDLFNYDARQVSLMAWNGSNGLFAGQPGYVSYTSWRNTPAEEAMRDQLVSHANLPLGSRLWTFGSMQHVDDDGWSAIDATVTPMPGKLSIATNGDVVTLQSPGDQVIRSTNARALVLGIGSEEWTSIEVLAERDPGSGWQSMGSVEPADPARNTPAGVIIPIRWPAAWAKSAIAERLQIVVKRPGGTNPLVVHRVALLGALTVDH